jgi:rubrerythrin
MSKTEDALKEAFAGESQANRKYLAFAAKADQEGFIQAARLFRAAAKQRRFTPTITCVSRREFDPQKKTSRKQ